MELSDSLENLKGIGPETLKKLNRLGLATFEELLEYYPRRYEDYSVIEPIKDIKPGPVTIQIYVKQVQGRYVRRGLHITEAVASDLTGSVRLLWFNQPYREKSLKRDAEYFVSGEFVLRHQRFTIINPSIELVKDFPVNTARILPIYRETKGLRSRQIRDYVNSAFLSLVYVPETLPEWLIEENKLLSRHEALKLMHIPKRMADVTDAKRRLGFEELFQLSLASTLNKNQYMSTKALAIPFEEKLARQFVGHLPFRLTDSQRKVVWQIFKDMQKPTPMNRLVEGDVGSGKTVVAAMAGAMALQHDFQVAFMAPTELLARQHADTIHQLLKPLGMAEAINLLVGSLKPAMKKVVYQQIKTSSAFVIGTQALIQENVDMRKLGLVIVDEQHRFGVEQRKALQAKAGHMPHILSMTATPIPRSLALTLYGELDISILDQKPDGRKQIITQICSPNSRRQLYKTIEKELKSGRQMFVVCPLITESQAMNARSAEQVHEELSKVHFKHRRVALLHGKMAANEKETVMSRFIQGEIEILVSTTVIEVGVNVPNASIMLIENAENFGLAQLHQLRGRVGRSEHQGYCFLMLGDSQQPSRRLRALESSQDGFALAELDLDIRGPGAIYGTTQHGQLDLRVAQLSDAKLIAMARSSVPKFIERENLLQYHHLHNRVNLLRAITNLN